MRSLHPIGTLTQHPHIPEWWTSRPVPLPYFGGTEVPFTIMVETPDGSYPADVSDAIQHFLRLDERDRMAASDRVFKNYRKFADAVDDVDLEIDDPAQVWRYVRPTDIYVDRRDRWDRDVYVQVACRCEWEIEHGLQLVFRRGSKLVRVSAQDGHLTHADAYDLPEDRDDI